MILFYRAAKCTALLYNQLLASEIREGIWVLPQKALQSSQHCKRSRGAAIFKAGLGSLVPACPQRWLVLNCHVPILQFYFRQSQWIGVPKELGWAWIFVNRLWALYSLQDVWKSYPPFCETKYWQRTETALWGQQSAVISVPALNMSDSILHTPVQTKKGPLWSKTHGQYNPSDAAGCWDTESLSFISSNSFSSFPLPCW